MKPRIAVAGFQHETNTFAPSRAGWTEFEIADSWPGFLAGADVITGTQGMNLPIAGAISAAQSADFEIVPVLWCAAEPSGPVTDDAFGRISTMITTALAQAGPIDCLYLDLHGAMVTNSHDDGEGALLQAIRAQTGPELPIGVSLDLHANLSEKTVALADVITIYRTYPHLDMAETGSRCFGELQKVMAGTRRHAAFRQPNFLIPLHAQYTGNDPCRALYDLVQGVPETGDEYIEFAMGFTAADITDCGPAVIAYAHTADRAGFLADKLCAAIEQAAGTFETDLLAPEDAIARATAQPGTVVLADVQDNAGAGGSSDTTGLLRALVNAGARDALLGVMADPETARIAHEQGKGAIITADLGGKSGLADDRPFTGEFEVLALSTGTVEYAGEMYGGGVAELGPSCLLAVHGSDADVRIIVSSQRIQCLDTALFTHFGINPAEASIVCVKSTVHFRADFDPISEMVLNVACPGYFPCDLHRVQYRKASRPPLPLS